MLEHCAPWSDGLEMVIASYMPRCTNSLSLSLFSLFWRFCSGAFIRQIRGCHNFILNKYMALHHGFQIIHLEGAFTGIF